MTRRKRKVPRRMPVLRHHDVLKFLRGLMDRLNYALAVPHSERSARAEVILHINY